MYQLIYVSEAVKPMSAQALEELLLVARKKNRDLKITGMLLYLNNSFLQVLEGPEENVKTLYQRIIEDERHRNIKLVEEMECDKREFGSWSMGFENLDDVEDAPKQYYRSFLDNQFLSSEDAPASSKSRSLLNQFKKQGSLD